MSEIKLKDPDLLERIKELSNINRGRSMTEGFKALRSTLTKGENNPMYGRTNEDHPRFGTTHTAETLAKMSEI